MNIWMFDVFVVSILKLTEDGLHKLIEGYWAKGIWKQDTEANIWALVGLKWGVEKAPKWLNS